MKFLICEASEDQLDFSGDFDLFKAPNGTMFNYEVDFDVDTVRIKDTIGRMVPVGVEELDQLIFTLNRISNYVKSKETLNDFLFERLTQGFSSK